jgi:hypothetical protein
MLTRGCSALNWWRRLSVLPSLISTAAVCKLGMLRFCALLGTASETAEVLFNGTDSDPFHAGAVWVWCKHYWYSI